MSNNNGANRIIETWPQRRARHIKEARSDYQITATEAEDGLCWMALKTDWTNDALEWMKTNVPSRRLYNSLLRDLGAEIILRRVMHDAPDMPRRYIDAGIIVSTDKETQP